MKNNALAGHSFTSMEALEQHLAWWMREIADLHCHGSTGEPPLQRFVRDEASKLKPLDGWLSRLKLSAIRDQLDTLLDEKARPSHDAS